VCHGFGGQFLGFPIIQWSAVDRNQGYFIWWWAACPRLWQAGGPGVAPGAAFRPRRPLPDHMSGYHDALVLCPQLRRALVCHRLGRVRRHRPRPAQLIGGIVAIPKPSSAVRPCPGRATARTRALPVSAGRRCRPRRSPVSDQLMTPRLAGNVGQPRIGSGEVPVGAGAQPQTAARDIRRPPDRST
jgi:hypothetical protein